MTNSLKVLRLCALILLCLSIIRLVMNVIMKDWETVVDMATMTMFTLTVIITTKPFIRS